MPKHIVKILKSMILWIATIGVGGLFLVSGVMKLSGAQEAADMMAHYGYPEWFLYLIGAAEVVGAVLLFIPRVSSLGALTLGGIMFGAIFTHMAHFEWMGMGFTALLFGLLVMVGYARQDSVIERFRIRKLAQSRRQ